MASVTMILRCAMFVALAVAVAANTHGEHDVVEGTQCCLGLNVDHPQGLANFDCGKMPNDLSCNNAAGGGVCYWDEECHTGKSRCQVNARGTGCEGSCGAGFTGCEPIYTPQKKVAACKCIKPSKKLRDKP